MGKFRFQDLEIWKDAIKITHQLFDIADQLEEIKKFRFAEQLRSAALSISNNIAEGSGSSSKKDFASFLNISRRSTFENANMILLFASRGLLEAKLCDGISDSLDVLCRRITRFQRVLLGSP